MNEIIAQIEARLQRLAELEQQAVLRKLEAVASRIPKDTIFDSINAASLKFVVAKQLAGRVA